MLVRRETVLDHTATFAIHASAFAPRDGVSSVEARLVEQLRAADDVVTSLSFVVEVDGAVVGHLLTSRATIGVERAIAIGPLGVLPAHQGVGVGSALMHAAIGAADALDQPLIVLLGDPAYYRRFGFVPAAGFGVISPQPEWGGYFQVRLLTAWTDRFAGQFRYAAPFDGV